MFSDSLVLFLFTALPEDKVQAFCTRAPHRAVLPCDSTAFLLKVLRSIAGGLAETGGSV